MLKNHIQATELINLLGLILFLTTTILYFG